MNNNPIGIFDSGVGGLSVLSEIQKILPQESIIYLADQAYMPYGLKTKEELVERVSKILHFMQINKVKAVVIACNTATIFTIAEMREKFTYPIIGVVPVVKTIASATKTGKIAVFSTKTTASSPYLTSLVQKYAFDKTVFKIGDTHLEDYIEHGEIKSARIISILHRELQPLVKKHVDSIALGCTHYSFIKPIIEKIVGPNILVADSAGAVARRLGYVLEQENILSTHKMKDLYYTTGDKKKFESVAKKLLKKKIEAEHIDL